MKNSNLLIMMSGGTSPVINATLAGILFANNNLRVFNKIYAGNPGIIGLMKGNFRNLSDLNESQIDRLMHTPGSAVTGTSRIPLLNSQDEKLISKYINQMNISALVNIGGNGTIKQTRAISSFVGSELQVAACPKTVDNDLGDMNCQDVFFTPGFPSCVNYWAKAIQLLNIENLGAYSHDRVLVVQTFGRETGFIAGSLRIIDPYKQLPLVICLPEDQQPLAALLSKIDSLLSSHERAIVVLSEGYKISELNCPKDYSGQNMYGSSVSTSAQLLVEELISNNIQARSIIPTILQRQCIDSVLPLDRYIAKEQGKKTVQLLSQGKSSFLSTIKASFNCQNHEISSIEFSHFDNYSRTLNESFIQKGEFDVSADYLNYLNSILLVSSSKSSYGFLPSSFFY